MEIPAEDQMKNRQIPENALVIRKLEWKEDQEGRVTLLRPCLGNSRIGKRIAEILRFDDYRIRLDRIGSAVWKLSDGGNDVKRIRTELARMFPEEAGEMIEERLNAFLHQMNRSRIIEILGPGPNS